MGSHAVNIATVIVADDSPDIRKMIRFILEMLGHRVVEAENGRVAVELAKRESPDLILMDLNMPVLDGLTATRLLRQAENVSAVPIIAISANHKESAKIEALAAGCVHYLCKPLDFSALYEALNRFLKS